MIPQGIIEHRIQSLLELRYHSLPLMISKPFHPILLQINLMQFVFLIFPPNQISMNIFPGLESTSVEYMSWHLDPIQ
jgi:hypothetical protein